MISKSAISDARQARSYYGEQAKNGEYYSRETVPTEWGGAGSLHAGLVPGSKVEPETFERVLTGQMPNGQQLGKQTVDGIDHRCGWDFTFSAPKSVSLLSEVAGDVRVRAAHELAVEHTMAWLEQNAAQARVTENGVTRTVDTGNLLYAKFSHETSRELDPQTHTHVVIANATYDAEKGVWRSLSNEKLFELRATADNLYKNEMAGVLQKLGYEVSFDRNGNFEIKGISREQIEGFSKRANLVEARLAEWGLSRDTASAEQKQAATLQTRAGKEHAQRNELAPSWRAQAKAAGVDLGSMVEQAKQRAEQAEHSQIIQVRQAAAAERAISSAVLHLAEREQAFSFKDLMTAAAEYSRGQATINGMQKAITSQLASGELVSRHDGVFTTRQAIEAETDQGRMIRSGFKGHRVIAGASATEKAIRSFEAGKFELRGEQRDAVRLISTTREQFIAIQGYAGTGKTAMLEAVRHLAEQQGWQVQGMSAGANQAGILERDSGIKSQTVSSFLIASRQASTEMQRRSGNQPNSLARTHANPLSVWCGNVEGVTARAQALVGSIRDRFAGNERNPASTTKLWVVDEASMLSQKDFNAVMREAQAKGAKVVFVGDRAQHQSVEAGRAFDLAQKNGMRTARLEQVRRQEDDAGRSAVRDLLAGRATDAFERLKRIEVSDNSQLIKELARDFSHGAERDKTIIVTATNADRQAINEAIRVELKQLGVISGKAIEVEILRKVDLTREQGKYAVNYESGNVLRVGRDYLSLGLAKGEYLKVVGLNADRNVVSLAKSDGSRLNINPKQHRSFEAYHQEKAEFVIGDKVRFNRNDKMAGVRNGQLGTVEIVDGNRLTLRMGDGGNITVDTSQYRHLEHGYASTTYSSQGQTEAKTLYHINAERGGSNERAFYVGITRAKGGTVIYATDVDKARDLVAKGQTKTTATEQKDIHVGRGMKL